MMATLQRIAKQAVLQGNHRERIIDFYGVLVKEARREFNEDNLYTLDSFLRECHEEALKRNGYDSN